MYAYERDGMLKMKRKFDTGLSLTRKDIENTGLLEGIDAREITDAEMQKLADGTADERVIDAWWESLHYEVARLMEKRHEDRNTFQGIQMG